VPGQERKLQAEAQKAALVAHRRHKGIHGATCYGASTVLDTGTANTSQHRRPPGLVLSSAAISTGC
jgi:hypothetical protein